MFPALVIYSWSTFSIPLVFITSLLAELVSVLFVDALIVWHCFSTVTVLYYIDIFFLRLKLLRQATLLKTK